MDEIKIYNEFAKQLSSWSKTNEKVCAGNQDILYALEMQKERMDKFHVRFDYDLYFRGEWMDDVKIKKFYDLKHKNYICWRFYRNEIQYYLEDKKELFVKENKVLYAIITDLKNEKVKEMYYCPNCGALSDTQILMNEGCPYCHTHFIMSDLFPKVTNYYLIEDASMTQSEAKKNIKKVLFIGGIIGACLGVISTLTNTNEFYDYQIIMIIITALFAGGIGALAAYFIYSISLFIKVVRMGFKSMKLTTAQLNAQNKLPKLMKPYDSTFSFEYFTGKVSSLLKSVIFSDDISKLSIYEGDEDIPKSFSNIVDAQFSGAIGLDRFLVEGAYCYLDLKVYMQDVYCKGNKLVQEEDVFKVGLCKKISNPVDYGFSIKKVQCKSCGASFDATKQNECPYCHSHYNLKEDDWVITYIK